MTPYRKAAPGIYKDARGLLWERPWVRGKRTWRRLFARSIKLAKEEIAARRSDQGRARLGLAVDPYQPTQVATVGEVLDAFENARFPDRHGHPTRPDRRKDIESHLRKLRTFWPKLRAADVTAKDCRAYFETTARRGGTSGRRATDRELQTLANAFRFAVAEGTLTRSPFADGRPRFTRADEIEHSRDHAPASTVELHRLAAMLFESRRSEVLGWQLLFEAFTGCRTVEALALRLDAAPRKPGHVADGLLWLDRRKGGVNPAAVIHPGLKKLLAAHSAWHSVRFPASPWYLPSDRTSGPVSKQSLTHALRAIAPLASNARRTSHGLRAFFVTVRRSQGIPDGQIAAEIGDRSGASLIASTYGGLPPNWQAGRPLTWLPERHPPAWTELLQRLTAQSSGQSTPTPAGDLR